MRWLPSPDTLVTCGCRHSVRPCPAKTVETTHFHKIVLLRRPVHQGIKVLHCPTPSNPSAGRALCTRLAKTERLPRRRRIETFWIRIARGSKSREDTSKET